MNSSKKSLWLIGLVLCIGQASAQSENPETRVRTESRAEPAATEMRDAQILAQAATHCSSCADKVDEAKAGYTAKCGRAPTASELRAIALFDLHYGQSGKPAIQCF